ncbi:MAG: hypothetical protein IJR90_06735, partial [Clostridia bacterium]|nr:hypothetical protein [Clostridia bacterium]
MKKRLFAIILCVCMVMSVFPAFGSSADGVHNAQVFYDDNRGSVFMTAGNFDPADTPDNYLRSGDDYVYAESSGRLNILVEPGIRINWGDYYDSGNIRFEDAELDFEPTVNMVVRYDSRQNGWCEEVAVRAGVVCSDLFTSAGQNCWQINIAGIDEIDIEMYWSEAELDYAIFTGDQDKEILVEIEWEGRGEIDIPAGIAAGDYIRMDDRFKFRVSEGLKSVLLTWKEGYVLESILDDDLEGGWNSFPVPDVNNFTLQLDGRYAGSGVQWYYRLRFVFGDDHGRNWTYRVEYDENNGSVFSALGGEIPSADPQYYMFRDGQGERSFKSYNEFGEEKPDTINLVFDTEKRIDWNAWNDGNVLSFCDTDERDKRSINVVIEYETPDGYVYSGVYIMGGELVRTDDETRGLLSWSEGVLSFTPYNKGDVTFYVYWSYEDLQFGTFEPTEDYPILLEFKWWGRGGVDISEELDPENSIVLDQRVRVRFPESVHEVTFSWKPGYELRRIGVDGADENGDWLNIDRPEGTSYTMSLDQFWDNGYRKSHYYIEFDFEGGGMNKSGQFRVHYDQGRGSAFYALGADVPAEDEDHLYRDDDRVSFLTDIGPQTVSVLFDPYKAVDLGRYDNEGKFEFFDVERDTPPQICVSVNCELSDGTLLDNEPVVVDGVSVNQLFTFENNVLTFTPADDNEVELFVYWERSEFDFDQFRGTEEKPIVVSASWWGRGEITLSEQIDISDMMVRDGGLKVRVSEDTESLTFNWKSGYELRSIGIEGAGENNGWLDIDHPQGTSYTLFLDLNYDEDHPRDYYRIEFEFEGGYIDRNGELRLHYDQGKGSAFYALGGEIPDEDANHLARDDHRLGFMSDNGPQIVSVLIEPDRAVDLGRLDREGTFEFFEVDRDEPVNIFISVKCELADGRLLDNEPVVENGVSVNPLFTFENNILTFTPANDKEVELFVCWTTGEWDYDRFGGTEEKPVVVEVQWWNRGEVTIEDEIPAEDVFAADSRVKIRVPLDKETVTLTWKPGYQLKRISANYLSENNDWAEVYDYQGTSWVITLDEIWGDGSPRDYYAVNFDFEGWIDRQSNFEVGYGEWRGSVFAAVGDEQLSADSDHYMFRDEDGVRSFNVDGHPATIRLLIDPTKRLDFDRYYSGGGMAFVDTEPIEDLSISISAYFEDPDGYIFYGLLVDRGVAVTDYATFENNILTFTPSSSADVSFCVFWTDDECAFGMFDRTEERPIKIDINWWGHGDVSLPDTFPAEDYIKRDGSIVARVTDSTDELKLSWSANDKVRVIRVHYEGEGENDFEIRDVDGSEYYLEFDKPGWGDEPYASYYRVEIEFEDREVDDYTVRLDFPGSEGSVFFNVGEPAPSLDIQHYMPVADCRYDVVDDLGNVSIGTVYITLDPTRSVNWFEWSQNGNVVFWDLPENSNYSPYIIVNYQNADGEWIEQFAVVEGRSTDPKFGFTNNVFSFTPETSAGVWVQIYWSRANMDYERFGPTEDKPICVDIMGGNGASPHIPEGIPGEDVAFFMGAEHAYTRIRLPGDATFVEFTWDMPRNVYLIVVNDDREEDGVAYYRQPEGTSFTLELDQTEWDYSPKSMYYIRFWFYFYNPVDLSEVFAVLDVYDGLDLTAYTDESVQTFTTMTNDAFAVFNDFYATQNDLDTAVETIYAAIAQLVYKDVIYEVDNYKFIIKNGANVNFMRIAPGVLTTSSEIRNHPELISVDKNLCDSYKDENGVLTYDFLKPGIYSIWVRYDGGKAYILSGVDITNITPSVREVLGLTVSVDNLVLDAETGVKDIWIARGTLDTYSQCKDAANKIVQVTANKIALANNNYGRSYQYQIDYKAASADGNFTVCVRYNDNREPTILHLHIDYPQPEVIVNGLQ